MVIERREPGIRSLHHGLLMIFASVTNMYKYNFLATVKTGVSFDLGMLFGGLTSVSLNSAS